MIKQSYNTITEMTVDINWSSLQEMPVWAEDADSEKKLHICTKHEYILSNENLRINLITFNAKIDLCRV